MPLLQVPEQHSMGDPQGTPSGEHCEKPQVNVFGSQKPLQHSNPLLHGNPSGEHIGLTHELNSQVPEQHSLLLLQGKLLGKQLPIPQVFERGSHAPVQHSKSFMQNVPSGVQVKPHVNVLGLQKPAQHSKSDMQNEPSGKQPPKPHVFVAKSQLKLQH
jgi:hypothetical protein